MKKLWLFTRIALFVLAVWYILTWIDIATLQEVVVQSNPFLLVLAFLAVFITHLLRGTRLLLILHAAKVKTMYWKAFCVYAISAFWGRITPGKLGEFGKVGYFTKKKTVFPYVVLERVMDVVAIIIIAAPLSWVVHPLAPYWVWGAVGLVGILSLFRPFLRFMKRMLGRFIQLPKTQSGMLMANLFGITILSWITSLTALYFVAINVAHFDIILFLAAAALAVVVGIVSGVPGGFGTREATLAYLLNVAFGTPLGEGTSIAIYAIVVVTLSEFILFLIGNLGAREEKDLDEWKQEELKLHDAKLAEEYESKRERIPHGKFYQHYWMQRMLDAGKQGKVRVLDYCCGTSLLYPHIKKAYPKAEYVGIDLSPEMLAVGKKRYGKRKDFTVLQRDGEDLQLKQRFDIVIARGAIHHLPRPVVGLEEIANVLKKDGVLLISEPAANPLIKLARWVMYKTSSHFSSKHRSFTSGQLKRMLRKANYEIIREERFGFVAYIIGFPDVLPAYKIVPLSLHKKLVKVDEFLGKIPFIKQLSFSVIITARPKRFRQ